MAYFGGIFFANIGDGGVQNCFQRKKATLSMKERNNNSNDGSVAAESQQNQRIKKETDPPEKQGNKRIE